MQKYAKILLLTSIIVLLAAGCNNTKPAQQNQPQGQKQGQTQNQPTPTSPQGATIIVSQTVEGSNLNQPSYTVPAGESEMDLLKKSHAIEVKSYSFGDMVIGIDGIKPDSKHFWEFFVNGKSSNVGASSYILKNGDKIEWKLSAISSSGQ